MRAQARRDLRPHRSRRCAATPPIHWDDDRLTELARTVKRREFTVGVARARGRVGTLQWASNSVADAEERVFTAFAAGIDANAHRLTRTAGP